jgi:hypothetical protein
MWKNHNTQYVHIFCMFVNRRIGSYQIHSKSTNLSKNLVKKRESAIVGL